MQPRDVEHITGAVITAYVAEQVDALANEAADDETRKELQRAAEIIRSTCTVPR